MARGNKFKPKPVPSAAKEEEGVAAAAAAAATAAAAAAAAHPAATAPPAPARDRTHTASTTTAAAAGPPPAGAKKRKAEPAAAAPTPATPAPAPKRRVPVQTLVAPPTPAGATTTTPSTAVGAANWLALKAAASIGKKHGGGGGGGGGKQAKRAGAPRRPSAAPPVAPIAATATPSSPLLPAAIGSTAGATRVLAMDCEMVGVGPGGARSALARVCLVNDAGHVVLDTHVAPRERVTDHRTHVSGVSPADLRGAPDLDEVRARVERLLAGRTLVGHALAHDLGALMVSHPRRAVRDTSTYPPFMRATAPGRRPKPRRLRDLAAEVLGLAIQGGAHSPVDDARAALYLYQAVRREWEAAAAKPGGVARHLVPPVRAGGRAVAKAAAEDATAKLGALAAEDDMADL